MRVLGYQKEGQRSEFGFIYLWGEGPRKRRVKFGDILGYVKSEQQNSLVRRIDSERNELSVTFGDGYICQAGRSVRYLGPLGHSR